MMGSAAEMGGAAIRVHQTATVERDTTIGAGTQVWHEAQVRAHALVGQECILGKGVFIDSGVRIGNRVKIQNYACIYHGSTIEDGVFIGPHVVLTNDRLPRSITPSGALKTDADWRCEETRICYGASLGARSVVLPGITVGAWAIIGAGAVVTADVPAHGLVVGCPARLIGFVCACGIRRSSADGRCPECGWLPVEDYEEMRAPTTRGHLNVYA
jgi:UDP-2-acetamido-3-amino-2,3-dideoxy-glucuronate N-acetyltransferase